jgi:hypothetical protein
LNRENLTLNNLVVVGMLSLGMLIGDIESRGTNRRIRMIIGNPPKRVTKSIDIMNRNIDVDTGSKGLHMMMRANITDPAGNTGIGSGQRGRILTSKKKRRKGASIESMMFEFFSILAAEIEIYFCTI